MKYLKMIHNGFSIETQTSFITLETFINGMNTDKLQVAVYKAIKEFNNLTEERFVHYVLTIDFVNKIVKLDRKEGFE